MEDVEDMEMSGISYDSLTATANEPVLDTANLRAHPQQAALLQEIERKKRARQIPVPTDNARVIALLREYGEPITYFGEDPSARRDRLREVLSQRLEKGERVRTEVDDDDDDDEEGEYYTPGEEELLDARKDIARFSLERARKRLARQKVEAQLLLPQIVRYRKTLSTRLQSFTPLLSELGGSRAVSSVQFSPVSKDDEAETADSPFLLSANWSGQLQLFELPDLTPVREYRGHSSFAGGISWLGTPPSEISDTNVNFISGGGDGEILLWNINNTSPLHSLQPHTQRIFKTAIHPSEKYFAATSFDTTWSLSSFRNTTDYSPTRRPLCKPNGMCLPPRRFSHCHRRP